METVKNDSMETYDFFISYAKENEERARQVVNLLERNGYTACCQYKNSPPGKAFLDWINEAVRGSRNFILIWSDAASR